MDPVEVDTTETPDRVPPPLDPYAVIDRLTGALEALASQRASATGNDQAVVVMMMEKLTAALARVSEAQVAGSKMIADETRKAHRPSNEIAHFRSPFNPRGERDYPRPKLKCLMMIPWLLDRDSCTREEIELANLLETGEYVVKRVDGTKFKVMCKVHYALDDKTPSRLIMTNETAFNNDYFKLMPSLVDYLRQVLKQHNPDVARQAAAVLSMDEEEALIASEQLPISA